MLSRRFQLRRLGQSCGQRRGLDTQVIDIHAQPMPQFEPQAQIAEQASGARQRAERVWLRARAAQRSAAESMEKSAASQEQTARSYEAAALHCRGRDKYWERAARHREFAQEDREMAERLRRMAESDATWDCWMNATTLPSTRGMP
jgi:hypothetical protein